MGKVAKSSLGPDPFQSGGYALKTFRQRLAQPDRNAVNRRPLPTAAQAELRAWERDQGLPLGTRLGWRTGDPVMVGDCQHLVAILAMPIDDRLGRPGAVRLGRVSVQAGAVPLAGCVERVGGG